MTSGLRSTLAALLLSLGLFLPGTASGLAILHISESSVRQSGNPPAALGYFERADPDLEFWNTQETPRGPHVVGGVEHSDSLFTHSARYRDLVSVNNQRILFGAAEGPLDPGHSRARASGFADAADRTLGGYASARSTGGSTAAAQTAVEMHYTITVGPGASGLALGAPVEGLRFEFDADGFLRVGGKTFPHSTAVAASAGVSAFLFRQHGAICIQPDIECQTNADAAAVRMESGVSAAALDPDEAAGRTGLVTNGFSWRGRNNTGVFKGGGVFSRGDVRSEIPRFAQDADFSEVIGFDSDQLPFGDIEFNATVGEQLRLEVDLDLSIGVDDEGFAEVDIFNTFTSSVVDPQRRGLQIVYQFAPAEPPPPPPPPDGVPGPATLLLWGIGLAGLAVYKRRSGRP